MARSGITRRSVAAAVGSMTGVVLGAGAVEAVTEGESTPTGLPADLDVVFHVSDDDHWPYALSNLENLSTTHPAARIRVVVDGTGDYALQGSSDVVARLATLAAKGVSLEVCPNALREHRIAEAAMPAFAATSLGGVIALATAQREGYAYVKP